LSFETDNYIIILRENALEIDLKEGIRAFLEYLFEEHKTVKRILGWVIGGLFPQDIFIDNIVRAFLSPEGEVIIKVRSRRGTKKVTIPELSPSQGTRLVNAINSLIGKKRKK